MMNITRRYAKKFLDSQEGEAEEAKGYFSMSEVAKDMGEVVDVLWLSGTRKYHNLMVI